MATTTFSELLSNLNKLLTINKADKLRSIKDIREGVVKTPPLFPLIAIIPVRRRTVAIYTEKIDVEYTVRFDIYSLALESKAAFNQSLGIVNTLKEILGPSFTETGYQVPNINNEATCCSSSVSDERFMDPQPFKGSFMQYALVQFDFRSERPIRPIPKVYEVELKASPPKELMEVVHQTLKAYRFTELDKVKTFKVGTLTPVAEYPLVYTTVDETDTSYGGNITSVSTQDHLLKIWVVTQQLDTLAGLRLNLDIIETIYDITFANQYFGGRVMALTAPVIDVGELEFGDTFLYGTSLESTMRTVRGL